MVHIYMVRHAESPFIFWEEKSRGLSDEGVQNSVKVADLLEDVVTYGYEFWESTSKPDVYRLGFENNTLIGVERLWG